MATAKTTEALITPVFRVSFNHLWKPSKNDDGSEVYSVTGIFDPKDPDVAAGIKVMSALVNDKIVEKWKGKKAGVKMPFRKGTAEEYDLDKYPEYEGMVIATFRSYGRPVGVVNTKKQSILDQEDFYSGCFAIASYSIFTYDRKDSKGVSFGLHNVMKVKNGEHLVAQHKAENDFAAIDPTKWGDENEEMFAEEDEDALGLG